MQGAGQLHNKRGGKPDGPRIGLREEIESVVKKIERG